MYIDMYMYMYVPSVFGYTFVLLLFVFFFLVCMVRGTSMLFMTMATRRLVRKKAAMEMNSTKYIDSAAVLVQDQRGREREGERKRERKEKGEKEGSGIQCHALIDTISTPVHTGLEVRLERISMIMTCAVCTGEEVVYQCVCVCRWHLGPITCSSVLILIQPS